MQTDKTLKHINDKAAPPCEFSDPFNSQNRFLAVIDPFDSRIHGFTRSPRSIFQKGLPMNIKRSLQVTLTFAALTLASMTSHALVSLGDSYGNLAAPGVYFGSGNPNGDWTINTGGGGELGLRAKVRFGPTLDGSSGTYFAAAGNDPTTSAYRATWNFEYSVNSTGKTGFTYFLGIDNDPSASVNLTFVNLSAISSFLAQPPAGYKGFQESSNIGFSSTPGGPFNINSPGLYTFVLQARGDGVLGNSVNMNVQVGAIPEPETYALMAAGLGLMAFVARRRGKRAAA